MIGPGDANYRVIDDCAFPEGALVIVRDTTPDRDGEIYATRVDNGRPVSAFVPAEALEEIEVDDADEWEDLGTVESIGEAYDLPDPEDLPIGYALAVAAQVRGPVVVGWLAGAVVGYLLGRRR